MAMIDLKRAPQCAISQQLFSVPPLIRKRPAAIGMPIGGFSGTEQVLVGLGPRTFPRP